MCVCVVVVSGPCVCVVVSCVWCMCCSGQLCLRVCVVVVSGACVVVVSGACVCVVVVRFRHVQSTTTWTMLCCSG